MALDHDFAAFPELSNSQLEEFQFSSPHQQITEDFSAVVEKVIDGDTVSLVTSFRDFSFPLRFLDVDAPEMNAGGASAKEWLRTRVEGTVVQVLIDRKNRVGKYGRLLGRVFFNGLVVSEEMLTLGLVKPFGKIAEGEVPVADKIFAVKF